MKTLSFHNLVVGRAAGNPLIEVDTERDQIEFSEGLNLIVAPNGYGKSTFLITAAGLLRPLKGEIRFGGQLLNPEEDLLYVSEYLAFPKYVYPREWIEFYSQRRGDEKVDSWIPRFRLENQIDRYMGEMSQGERRKFTWLAALQSGRSVLLFDEPLDGLDLLAVDQAREMLKSWKSEGKIIIVVTHQVGDILNLCDQIFFIRDRKLRSWNHFFSQSIRETSSDQFRKEVLSLYSS